MWKFGHQALGTNLFWGAFPKKHSLLVAMQLIIANQNANCRLC